MPAIGLSRGKFLGQPEDGFGEGAGREQGSIADENGPREILVYKHANRGLRLGDPQTEENQWRAARPGRMAAQPRRRSSSRHVAVEALQPTLNHLAGIQAESAGAQGPSSRGGSCRSLSSDKSFSRI